ncbi:MAG: thioredoxin family protein [Bacteroidota bacterium]|nr:thioredoxin family protein [Bacteroidota bacterium]
MKITSLYSNIAAALLFALPAFFSACSYSTASDTEMLSKETNGSKGFTRAGLDDTIEYPWFKPAYDAYEPNSVQIEELKKIKNDISVIAFGGEWCSDTREYLPLFYKVMEQAEVPAGKIRLVEVDTNKESADKSSKKYKIMRVPTFVLFYKGKEIGRVTDKLEEDLETDILAVYTDKM